MRYSYTNFIKQNIAPKGATSIVVFNSNNVKICSIGLGKMHHPIDNRLYSFGLISDLHFVEYGLGVTWSPSEKVDNALTYFENNNCAFCATTGDVTNRGFYESGGTTFNSNQFEEYKRICDKHTINVYNACGNHDSYFKPVTESITELESYTGKKLNFLITQGDDIHIFLGQPSSGIPMSDEALQWLYEMLEMYRNKRCFIYVHPYLDCGNANSLYGNDVFSWWGTKTSVFKNLLKHYKNTILFHGHSHNDFNCQEVDKIANYNESTGFRTVHIPSLSRPTQIIDGVRTTNDNNSFAYLVDVYTDYVILNGIDLINNGKVEPLGTYKIDTALVNIPQKAFTDSTGIITV